MYQATAIYTVLYWRGVQYTKTSKNKNRLKQWITAIENRFDKNGMGTRESYNIEQI